MNPLNHLTRILIGICLFSLLANYEITAQEAQIPPHIKMIRDGNSNFYDIQRSFDQYYRSRSTGKSTGYKQFKRMEYWWDQRLYPTGELPESGILWKEMDQFRARFGTSSRSNTGQWTERGPKVWQNNNGHWNPGLGRINVIAVHPTNPQIIYVGTPAGGVWKTANGGTTWHPLTDDLPTLGVSAIVIDHSNPQTVYIGTGDRDGFDTYGIGVLKSTDGGATWNGTSLSYALNGTRYAVNKLLMHPTNPQIIFAAATNGLYRTTNGGTTWTQVFNGDIDDLEFNPTDPSVVYAAEMTAARGTEVLKSTNGGLSFTPVGMTSASRAHIAITAAAPAYLYFFSSEGIYRSVNNGSTFTRRGDCPTRTNQNWYDWAIAVSPSNPNEVHVGAVETFASLNGGQSFTKTSVWSLPNSTGYVHADIHEMVFYGNTLYVGSDGLISTTTNAGNTWTSISEGLGIRQFYNIAISSSNPSLFVGGAQDNGTTIHNAGTGWVGWLGADGFEAIIDPTNNNVIYGTSQNGVFYKTLDGGLTRTSIAQPGDGAWSTPFVMDPTNNQVLYVGTDVVRKTTDGMASWASISSDFSNTQKITALAIAPSNNQYLYASKRGGIWRTKDGGQNWTSIFAGLPNLYITSISVHPSDPEKVAVTLSGYTQGEKVYLSQNAGTNWSNISSNLPNIPVNTLAFHNGTQGGMYIGMDVGVYYRDNASANWSAYHTDLPNVPIVELEIQYLDNTLKAATFGRGMWETPLKTGTNHTVCGTDNIALNKPVTVSSTTTGSSHIAANATDGDINTRWSSDFSDNQWLYVDLGQEEDICKVVIKWENAFAEDFDLIYWDGSVWQPIQSVTGNTNQTSTLDNLATKARYIGFLGKKRATVYGYSLWEFEVYGKTINNAPSINAATFIIPENSSIGTYVGAVSASDPDGDALVYAITGGNINHTFIIDPNTGIITVNDPTELDYETRTNIPLIVSVTDPGGLSASANIIVNLSDENDGHLNCSQNLALNRPVTFSSEENTINIAEHAVDGNMGTRWSSAYTDSEWMYVDLGQSYDLCKIIIRWEQAYGEDFKLIYWDGTAWQTFQTITGNTNLINEFASPNINARYVGFQGSKRATQYGYSMWEFEVYGGTSTNNPPTINNASFAIAENTANGTYVGTVSANDPDGDALTYAITGGNINGAFSINNSGEIYVNNSVELDYETITSFNLTVSVTDPGSLNASASVIINLTDEIESSCSQNLALNRPVTVSSEEAIRPGSNAVDGNMSTRWASDFDDTEWLYVDLGQSYDICKVVIRWEAAYAKKFDLIYWDGSAWQVIQAIDGNTSLTNEFNHLTTNARYIGFNGHKRATPYGYSIFELEVYGAGSGNQPPTINNTTFNLAENTPNGTYVGTINATDPDGDALTYAITGGNINGAFSINNSGQVYVSNSAELDYETRTSFSLTVSVTDPGSLSASGTAVINLLDQPECSTNIALGQPVTASSEEAIRPGSNAVDGNINTRWASNFTDGEWLYVDLGKSYDICKVVIKWEAAYGKDYDLIYWDGTAWQTLKSVVGNTNLTNEFNGLSTQARYIGFLGKKRGTSYGYSIFEFEVYGASGPSAKVINSDIPHEPSILSESQLNLYPNPVRSQLSVAFESSRESESSLFLLDLRGQIISQQKLHTFLGENTWKIATDELASGTYVIQLRNAYGVISKRFTKVN